MINRYPAIVTAAIILGWINVKNGNERYFFAWKIIKINESDITKNAIDIPLNPKN